DVARAGHDANGDVAGAELVREAGRVFHRTDAIESTVDDERRALHAMELAPNDAATANDFDRASDGVERVREVIAAGGRVGGVGGGDGVADVGAVLRDVETIVEKVEPLEQAERQTKGREVQPSGVREHEEAGDALRLGRGEVRREKRPERKTPDDDPSVRSFRE